MSTVRDILGVHAAPTVTSPMASVMSSIGMGKTTPTQKKRKSFASRMESKLVADLRDSMNPALAGSPTKPSLNRHWELVKFDNSAHPGKLRLTHWDYQKEREQYAGSRFNVGSQLPDLEDAPESLKQELVSKFKLRDITDLEFIFSRFSVFELRFVVIADHIRSTCPHPLNTLTIEDLKEIYYAIFCSVFPAKKCRFSKDLERERREVLQERFSVIAVEGVETMESKKKEEKRLQSEIKEMENKIKSLESDQAAVSAILFPLPCSDDPHGLVAMFQRTCVPGASKEGKLPSSGVIQTLRSKINFSTSVVPAICSRFSSPRVEQFLRDLGQLAEQEKQMIAFIKRKEGEIKALEKLLAKS